MGRRVRAAVQALSARLIAAAAALISAAALPASPALATSAVAACAQPVYLTFDTGHMGVAPLVAEVLRRHEVKVTFFLANERTIEGGSSLDERWAPWWRERVAEGHAFASHTWDHWVLQEPAPGSTGGAGGFRFKATQGPRRGQVFVEEAPAYCEQLRRPAARLQEMTGATMAAAFRAPAGRTSPALLKAARACGFEHVGWSPAGFLGDELDSRRFPNEQLLHKALREIRAGDVLVAHLGIWDRQDPWAPAVLEPLITGLKARGLCFRTLREHPRHAAAFSGAAPVRGLAER